MIDQDLDRNAAYNLDEVAGGVFGRERRKGRSAALLYAVDMPMQRQVRKSVDRDIHGLPNSHTGELRFLKVSGHPGFAGDDEKHLLAGLDEGPFVNVALGDRAILRSG